MIGLTGDWIDHMHLSLLLFDATVYAVAPVDFFYFLLRSLNGTGLVFDARLPVRAFARSISDQLAAPDAGYKIQPSMSETGQSGT